MQDAIASSRSLPASNAVVSTHQAGTSSKVGKNTPKKCREDDRPGLGHAPKMAALGHFKSPAHP